MEDVKTQPTIKKSSRSGGGSFQIPMRISERRLILFTLDLLAINGSLLLSLALRSEFDLSIDLLLRRPLWFIILSALWFPLAWALDLYDLRVASHWKKTIIGAGGAVGMVSPVYVLLPFLTPPLPGSRWPLFAFPLLLMTTVMVGRGLYLLVLSQPVFCRRTLIVGAGWAGRTIAQALVENGNGSYRIVGFADDDPAKQGAPVAIERTGPYADDIAPERDAPDFRVLGDRHALPDVVARHGVNTLVLAITHEIDGELLQILTDCLKLGVEITPMPELYERLTGRVPIEHVGENWYVAMPLDHPGTSATWPVVKRVLDVVSSSLGLICLGIAFPFIAVAITIDSPGPIFYTQERVGKGGKVFRVYKFRSMVADAEKFGKAVWAEENDPRVTRVGRLLRKMHVDEFPQFLNILKGEMSAVGPRPERPQFVEELAEEIPFYRVRHAVKPGMAGWGLVKQGYGASKEDAILKLQYDLFYIKHQSLWLDLGILLKTIFDTLTFGGRA